MERPQQRREDVERKLGILSERTLIPMGSLVILIGGIVWVVSMGLQASAAQKTVETVVQRLNEISERLARIEGRLSLDQGGKR